MPHATSPQDRTARLTIVTVIIEKHDEYVSPQIALIDAMNPGADWRMIVVDNAAAGGVRFACADPRVTVIPGAPPRPDLPDNVRGSYHHAAGLQLGVARAEGRWLLVLDPDLFVVYRYWIAETLAHVARRGLTFFGAPWHPFWYKKFRDFPSPHFLLIDTDRAPAGDLDFTPDVLRPRRGLRFAALVERWPFLSVRWHVGVSRDTGWAIRRAFLNRADTGLQLLLPVIDVTRDIPKPKFLLTAFGRWRERLLPRHLRLLPAPGTYVDPAQAPGFRGEAMTALAPEAFVWRGAPFAFHLRRHVRDMVRKTTTQDGERAALAEVLAKAQGGQAWVFRLPGEAPR